MAKKVILKDQDNVEILPITRGELIVDSSGKEAFHSKEFLATDSQPGLMSPEEKTKLSNIEGNTIDSTLSTTSTNPVQNKVVTVAINEAKQLANDAQETANNTSENVSKVQQIINSIKANYLKSATVNGNVLTLVDQYDSEITFTNTTYNTFLKETATNTRGRNGLVPKPNYNNGSKTRFLREDGTWVIPTNTSYTFANGADGSFTVTPSGGSGQKVTIGKPATAGTADKVAKSLILKIKTGTTEGTDLYTYDGSGAKTLDIKAGANITLTPTTGVLTISATNSNTTYTLSGVLNGNTFVTTLTPSSGTATTTIVPAMVGATNSAAGKAGLVPAPAANKHTSFLRGDGAWATPSDTHWTTHLYIGAKDGASNASTTNGNTYIKVTDNSTIRNQYIIKGAGRTTVTSDASGNITITSPTVTWGEISEKPSSFTPSSHNHPTSQINALTNYTKATSAATLATTDSLNTALGKLEYKAHYAYNWIIGVTATDTDEYINKWGEIVEFLDSVKEGTDITDEFVTRKTTQTITGLKTFQSNSSTTGVSLILKNSGWESNMSTAMDFYNGSAYKVPNARIETKMVGNGTVGGTLIFYTQTKHASTNPNPNGLTERLRIDDNGTTKITGVLTVTANTTASKFITSGGTSSQFVKGDGSLDGNTYVTTTQLGQYLPLSGGTITGTDYCPLVIKSGNAYYSTIRFITKKDNYITFGYKYLASDTIPNMFLTNKNGWSTEYYLLHTGNYNSYAPSLTGTGASGTWPISITGNADTIDGYHANQLLKLISHNTEWSLPANMPTNFAAGIHQIHVADQEYSSVLQGYDYNGSYWQLYFHPTSGYSTDIMYRASNTNWVTLITSTNYTSYVNPKAISKTIWGQTYIDDNGNFQNVNGPIRVYYKSADWDNCNEGIRLYGVTKDSSWSNLHFGCDPTATVGSHANQWMIGRNHLNQFGIFHGTDSTTGVIHIDTNNNVGIGTKSPAYKLDVNGYARFGSLTPADSIGIIPFAVANSGYSTTGWCASFGTSNGGILLGFRERNSLNIAILGTSGSKSMSICPDGGNVGIGTTSPSYKLHVNGSVNAAALYVNGVPVTLVGNYDNGDYTWSWNPMNLTNFSHVYGRSYKNPSISSDIAVLEWFLSDETNNNQCINLSLDGNIQANQYIYAQAGFKKGGSSNNYVLLGGGNHKAISDFSMAHSHPYLPLSGGTLTGQLNIDYNSTYPLSLNGASSYSVIKLKARGTNKCDIGWLSDNRGDFGYIANISHVGILAVNDSGCYYSKDTSNFTQYIIYHSGNLNASVISGLGTLSNNISGNAATATNADTVDYLHASSFVRSDTSHYMNYFDLQSIPKGKTQTVSFGWTDYQTHPHPGGLALTFHGDSSLRTLMLLFSSYMGDVEPYIYTSVDGGNWQGGHRIALLTSKVASSGHSDTSGIANLISTQVLSSDSELQKARYSGFYRVNGECVIHAGWADNQNTAGLDLRINDSSTSNLFYRARVGGGGIGSWKTILDSSNWSSYCAAASHTHSYLPLAGGTMNQGSHVVFPGTSTDTNYGGSIEFREVNYVTTSQTDWSYAPGITFHWGGRTVGKFGLKYDGNLAWAGQNIIHAGNIGSQSVSYATSAGNADTVDNYHAYRFYIHGLGSIDAEANLQNIPKDVSGGWAVTHSGWPGMVAVLSQGHGWSNRGIGFLFKGGQGSRINLLTQIDNTWSDKGIIAYTSDIPTSLPANGGTSSAVTINYNNDSNSTYQMLWGSGNYVYGTGGIYCNPYTDYLYAGSFYTGNWFRSSGATGWYNESYGGGLYMEDSTWVRIYNNKKFYVANSEASAIHSAGGVYVAGAVHSYANFLKSTCNGKTITIGSANDSFCHYQTDAPSHWFNKTVYVQGNIYGGGSYNRRLAYVDELPTNTWRGIVDNLTSTSTTESLTANMGRVLANGQSDLPVVLLAGTLYRASAGTTSIWHFTGIRHRSVSTTDPAVYVSGGVARFDFTANSGYSFSIYGVCVNHQASGDAPNYTSTEYAVRGAGFFWFGAYASGRSVYIRAICQGDSNNDSSYSNAPLWNSYGDGVTRIQIIAVGYAQ